MNMFEYIDSLKRPYDIFLFDSHLFTLPTHSHWHYYAEILYLLEGEIIVECDNQILEMSVNDLIFLYPKSIHSIYTKYGGRIRYAVLKFDLNEMNMTRVQTPWLRNIYANMQENPSIFIHFTRKLLEGFSILPLIMECLREIEDKKFGYQIQVQAILNMILITLIRIWQENGLELNSTAKSYTDTLFFDSIIEYIDNHTHERISVQDLAIKSNMSYPNFARNFKKMYGRSCNEYIEFVRVNKAHDMLLYTDFSLNYIASETGFYDCSHLIKTYKKIMGITPNQQRTQGH